MSPVSFFLAGGGKRWGAIHFLRIAILSKFIYLWPLSWVRYLNSPSVVRLTGFFEGCLTCV
jgi:hypothetical protein